VSLSIGGSEDRANAILSLQKLVAMVDAFNRTAEKLNEDLVELASLSDSIQDEADGLRMVVDYVVEQCDNKLVDMSEDNPECLPEEYSKIQDIRNQWEELSSFDLTHYNVELIEVIEFPVPVEDLFPGGEE
tara:strand:- start:838 stop:1230 length:393 start_codon:yes stop_codon:yes gene_type:complete